MHGLFQILIPFSGSFVFFLLYGLSIYAWIHCSVLSFQFSGCYFLLRALRFIVWFVFVLVVSMHFFVVVVDLIRFSISFLLVVWEGKYCCGGAEMWFRSGDLSLAPSVRTHLELGVFLTPPFFST